MSLGSRIRLTRDDAPPGRWSRPQTLRVRGALADETRGNQLECILGLQARQDMSTLEILLSHACS